jgi:hypothetical protein
MYRRQPYSGYPHRGDERYFLLGGLYRQGPNLGHGWHGRGHVSREEGGGPAPQVALALRNLRRALRRRLSRGPLSDVQANAVAAVLDVVATSVEQAR